jgi:hypothetical protein
VVEETKSVSLCPRMVALCPKTVFPPMEEVDKDLNLILK